MEQLPDAPLIRRPGEINAMDNPDFAALVKKAGKKQIVIRCVSSFSIFLSTGGAGRDAIK